MHSRNIISLVKPQMEFVFIVGAVQAFFLTVLIFNKKNKSTGDYVMAIQLALMGVLLVGYTLEVMGMDTDYPIFLGFYTAMPVLMGPLLYLYVLTYTEKSQRINPAFSLHSLPYILLTVAVFLKLTLFSEGSVIDDKSIIEDAKEPIFLLLESCRIYIGPIYTVICIFILRNHTKRIGKYFSYTENVDLKWLSYVIFMMVLIWVIVFIISIISNYNDFIPYRLGDNMIFATITIVVFLNGYYGIKQQIIFSPVSNDTHSVENSQPLKYTTKEKGQYLNSSLTASDSKKHLAKLLQFMDEEKPYLNGKLSLNEVAEKMEISINHLSQVINENLNKNFFDFVNSYRVECRANAFRFIDFQNTPIIPFCERGGGECQYETGIFKINLTVLEYYFFKCVCPGVECVKNKMADPSNKKFTLLALAYDSGFNSKSSFNSIFKKATDKTPSQYMQSLTV